MSELRTLLYLIENKVVAGGVSAQDVRNCASWEARKTAEFDGSVMPTRADAFSGRR